MYIHQLVIDNFKSFVGETVIPFEKGFTTVSGPNGSGKSNIIDSILFCLGLSTSRTMRAEKLSDLINNLSTRKSCQVTIVFRKETEELTEAITEQLKASVDSAPTVSEDIVEGTGDVLPDKPTWDPREYLVVSRRIRYTGNKSSGTGYASTYTLNGKTSTLTEIHEVLGKFHVSPGSFNVMMQGDVAGFIAMSPTERRKIIDEIAGVAEFDRKIDQAEHEIQLTSDNIERNQLLLGEITERLTQLAEERTHALKYQALRDEKQTAQRHLELSRVQTRNEALAHTRSNILQAKTQIAQQQQGLRQHETQLSQLRESLADISEQVKRQGEDQYIALHKQVESLKGHVARKQDATAFAQQQQQEHRDTIAHLTQEIASHHETLAAIDTALDHYAQQLKELQALHDKEHATYQGLNAQFDVLTDATGEVREKRQALRDELQAAETILAQVHHVLLEADAAVQREQLDAQYRQQAQDAQQSQRDVLTASLAQVKQAIDTAEMEQAAITTQQRKTVDALTDARTAAKQAADKANQLQAEVLQHDARKKAYEEMNLSRPVELILSAEMEGVHGPLGQLASADPGVTLALEIAMGGRLQNVVVDNERVASEAIAYLQQRQGGRATFLPLNKLQPARRLGNIPFGDGIVDYALNLLDFDSDYADAFFYALGDTLVVESMAAARPLMKKFRMVTLDGSLLEKSGAMTGGSNNTQRRTGAFGAANTQQSSQDTDLAALKDSLMHAMASKQRAEKTVTELELKLERVSNDLHAARATLAGLKAEHQTLSQQLAGLTPASDKPATSPNDTKKQPLQIKQHEAQAAYDAQVRVVNDLKAQLDALEGNLETQALATLREEMANVKFQLDYYDSQLRNVQTDMQSKRIERDYQEVGAQAFETRIAQLKEKITALDADIREHHDEISAAQVQLVDLEKQALALDDSLKQLHEARDAAQAALIEAEKAKAGLERQLQQADEQRQAFVSRERELQQELALLMAELTQGGISAEQITAEIQAALPLAPEPELQRKMEALTRKMEALEPVNMLAIDEYEHVNSRQGELREKVGTLESEKASLQERILSYATLKRQAFDEAFQKVDEGFKAIFAELADGQARLVLTNTESPFEGGMTLEAQPRGKKMQRIEAMSGGEKSLTSLAFVFSLQRYMPAPFYALDEVDMNLDGINVEKLARMIRRETLAKSAQFIVVSLRKPMIAHSRQTLGVTQKQGGITKVTGIKIREQDSLEHLSEELAEAAEHALEHMPAAKPARTRKKPAAVPQPN